MTPSQLNLTLADMSSRYNQALGSLNTLRSQAATKQATLDTTKKDLDRWAKTRLLLTKVSEFAREQSLHRIESLVSAALQAVIDDEALSFRIQMDTKGGAATAEWRIVKHMADGVTVEVNPESTDDGSVLDLVYAVLDLAIASLTGAGDVYMDEPVKQGFSPRYSANLAAFLREYAAKTGRRIVLITHSEDLAAAADVAYRVTQENGKSEVARVA
jgi:DNA repair exonuclease SbcCD ATPase subunit